MKKLFNAMKKLFNAIREDWVDFIVCVFGEYKKETRLFF